MFFSFLPVLQKPQCASFTLYSTILIFIFLKFTPSSDSIGIQAVAALSPLGSINTVIAVGTKGRVYVTTSALTSTPLWREPSVPLDSSAILNCVAGYGSSVAFAAGTNAVLIMTNDGGSTWTSLSASLLSGTGMKPAVAVYNYVNFQYRAISVLSSSIAYISASNGAIVRTGTVSCGILES